MLDRVEVAEDDCVFHLRVEAQVFEDGAPVLDLLLDGHARLCVYRVDAHGHASDLHGRPDGDAATTFRPLVREKYARDLAQRECAEEFDARLLLAVAFARGRRGPGVAHAERVGYLTRGVRVARPLFVAVNFL